MGWSRSLRKREQGRKVCVCVKDPRLDCHVYSLIKQGMRIMGTAWALTPVGDGGVGTGVGRITPTWCCAQRSKGSRAKDKNQTEEADALV